MIKEILQTSLSDGSPFWFRCIRYFHRFLMTKFITSSLSFPLGFVAIQQPSVYLGAVSKLSLSLHTPPLPVSHGKVAIHDHFISSFQQMLSPVFQQRTSRRTCNIKQILGKKRNFIKKRTSFELNLSN